VVVQWFVRLPSWSGWILRCGCSVVRSFAFVEWMDSSVWLFSGSFVCLRGVGGFFGVFVHWFVRLHWWSGWILRCDCSLVRSFALVEWMDSSELLFMGSFSCVCVMTAGTVNQAQPHGRNEKQVGQADSKPNRQREYIWCRKAPFACAGPFPLQIFHIMAAPRFVLRPSSSAFVVSCLRCRSVRAAGSFRVALASLLSFGSRPCGCCSGHRPPGR
jgi:hypothetical protein